MTDDKARIRRQADGTAVDYYTRSPHADYTNYYWYIGEDGAITSYYTPSQLRGIVIELSF